MLQSVAFMGLTGVGVSLLGWYDPYHLTIGVPVFVLSLVGVKWWQRRAVDDEETWAPAVDEDDREPPGRRFLRGVVQAGGALIGLALVFAALHFTPFEAWMQGPRCQELLDPIHARQTQQHYDRIVSMIDAALAQPLVASCRQTLRAEKVHTLRLWAVQAEPAQRQDLLQQALREADSLAQPALSALVRGDMQQIALQAQLTQVQQEKERLQRELERLAGDLSRSQERSTTLVEEKKQLEAQLAPLWDRIVELSAQLARVKPCEVRKFVLPDMLFEIGRWELTEPGKRAVQRMAPNFTSADLAESPMDVDGFADTTGNPEANKVLSQKRAEEVAKVLSAAGIKPSRLRTAGHGAERPAVSNDTPEGRAPKPPGGD